MGYLLVHRISMFSYILLSEISVWRWLNYFSQHGFNCKYEYIIKLTDNDEWLLYISKIGSSHGVLQWNYIKTSLS